MRRLRKATSKPLMEVPRKENMHIDVEEEIIYPIEVTNEEDWAGWVSEDNVQDQEEHSQDIVVQLNESNAQKDDGALKESEEKIGS